MRSLDASRIDPDADRVVRRLVKGGHVAYLVGGCVRDLLLGRKPKDFDVATSATPNEVKATFRNCRIIGRRFRLATVFFGAKIIETSTFRANPKGDEDEDDLLIRRDNVFGTETEDARRRDFTVNGLFYDVEAGRVIDHVDGLSDLDARLIRTIGDPEVRFQEDPIRMLRAIKFAARLGLTIEPATYRALIQWRGELRKAAPPRVLEEIYRLLRGGAAHRSFEIMLETGVLAVLSPALDGLLRGDGAPHVAAMPVPMAAPQESPAQARRRRAARELDLLDDEDRTQGELPSDEAALPAVDLSQLDPEERAWHAVWADGAPAGRATRFSPVTTAFQASGNGGNGASERRPSEDDAAARAQAWRVLGAIDAAGAAERDISAATALAALIMPFVAAPVLTGRPSEASAAAFHASTALINELRITRRDSERLRQILLVQRRVAAAAGRGVAPELLGGRDFFDDATALYGLWQVASGETATPFAPPADGGRAQASGGDADGDSPDGDTDGDTELDADGQPRKRRRRRRAGRRHRHDGPGREPGNV